MATSDAFYNKLVPKVEAIIAAYGTTFSVESEELYDEATMTTTPAGPPRQVIGLMSSSKDKSALASQIFAVTETSQVWKEQKVLIMPPSANPQKNEFVTIEGKTYSLGSVDTIKPADIVVLYMLGLGR